ncbi:MAG: hypothetical protein ACI9K5_003928, partial [Gammaproteobacteria bacterium]
PPLPNQWTDQLDRQGCVTSWYGTGFPAHYSGKLIRV